MIMGPAEKAPMAMRQIPAYWVEKEWCAVMRMARPTMVSVMQNPMKGERRRVASEMQAVIRHSANAAATGGTVCSWVCTTL